MKILSYLSFIFVIAINTGCSQNETKTGGEITFKETTTHNFGHLEYGSDGTHNFVFKNTGKKPLLITNVVSSCGCTVPVYPAKPIEKGKVDTIRVQYDTRRVGTFSKSITVHTTGSDKPVVLRITGEVLPPEPK